MFMIMIITFQKELKGNEKFMKDSEIDEQWCNFVKLIFVIMIIMFFRKCALSDEQEYRKCTTPVQNE